jgi:hypothetical protein
MSSSLRRGFRRLSRPRPAARRGAPTRRPVLEALDGRTLLSGVTGLHTGRHIPRWAALFSTRPDDVKRPPLRPGPCRPVTRHYVGREIRTRSLARLATLERD